MNSFEKFPSSEAPQEREPGVIKLTEEELKVFYDGNVANPELLALMKEKGISFDSGDIEIEVDGKTQKITTRKEDFGTRLLEEDEEVISSGVEKE